MKTTIMKLPSIIKTYYLIVSLFFVFTNILAQPYIYYPKSEGYTSSLNDIYRLNIATGEDNLFIKNVGHITTVFQNSDQTSIFLDQRGYLDVINVNNPNKRIKIAEGYENIFDIKDAPKINRVIIEYGDGVGFYKNTVIYNRDTYEPIDTIEFNDSLITFGDMGTFLSKDEKILYANDWDTTGVYFSAFDILNNTLLYRHRRVANLGASPNYGPDDCKQGKALFIYNNANGYEGQKFFIVNPDSGLYFAPVTIPPVYSKGHLSAITDYVIIEQIEMVTDDKNPNIGHEFHTGKIQIYSAITGDKITDIAFPPSYDSRIRIFDNYPNMFYYYDFAKNTTIPVDLTKLLIENNLSGLIKITVTKTDSINTFSYTITNSDTSSQAIKNIYMANNSTVTSANLPDGWTNITGADKFNLIGFGTQLSGIVRETSQSGYDISTTGLPTIGNVYLQSGRSRVDSADIFGNSFVIETIVPTSKPVVFDPTQFVDTLIYYNNKSLSNNWLTAEWVKNVLASSLNNVKLFINQKLYQSAVPVLQQLNMILDSYKTNGFVKDEAYYLLKINSEYLISKLNVLVITPPSEAVAQLDSIFAANELNKTNSWYSAAWVYNVLTSILNNAKITLNQNNLAGTKLVIQQFVITLDSYKTSGFITEEGLNNIKPKCLTLIDMLK